MKQKDVALVIVIAAISAIISFVVSGALFSSTPSRQQTAQVVPVISSTFTLPSNKYFNNQSIDPTQIIQIGPSNNSNAFNESSQ